MARGADTDNTFDAGNITPLRSLSDDEVLAFLHAQGRVTTLQVELAKRWGWSTSRVSRKLGRWEKAGEIVRRDGVIIAARSAPADAPEIAAPHATKPATATATVRCNTVQSADSANETDVAAREIDTAAGEEVEPPLQPCQARVQHQPIPPATIVESAAQSATTYAPVARTNWPLVVIAYGFALLGVSINIWNAWSGDLANTAIPAAMGVLAEGVLFFLPAWSMSLSLGRRLLAWMFLGFVMAFVIMNCLRMASIVAADTAMARADRQTTGVAAANQALEKVRAGRDKACAAGQGKSYACRFAQVDVDKAERARDEAASKVEADAKPDGADFALLVAWVTAGRVRPGSKDFEILQLLFRTLLPSVGGLVLVFAKTDRAH